MRTDYPVKILVAWAEAIAGNVDIRNWLMANGYQELAMSTFALRLERRSRDWLMRNGHPHLMAMIRGIEGDKQALQWLSDHDLPLMRKMAEAADDDPAVLQDLISSGHKELAMVAYRMGKVKQGIDEELGDVHKYPQY